MYEEQGPIKLASIAEAKAFVQEQDPYDKNGTDFLQALGVVSANEVEFAAKYQR